MKLNKVNNKRILLGIAALTSPTYVLCLTGIISRAEIILLVAVSSIISTILSYIQDPKEK